MNTWVIGIGTEHPDAVKTHKAFFTGLISALSEDLSQVVPLDQDNLNFDELAKFIGDSFPNIHTNEVATWKFILDKG